MHAELNCAYPLRLDCCTPQQAPTLVPPTHSNPIQPLQPCCHTTTPTPHLPPCAPDGITGGWQHHLKHPTPPATTPTPACLSQHSTTITPCTRYRPLHPQGWCKSHAKQWTCYAAMQPQLGTLAAWSPGYWSAAAAGSRACVVHHTAPASRPCGVHAEGVSQQAGVNV